MKDNKRGTLIQVWISNEDELKALDNLAVAVGGGLRSRAIRWMLSHIEEVRPGTVAMSGVRGDA